MPDIFQCKETSNIIHKFWGAILLIGRKNKTVIQGKHKFKEKISNYMITIE